MIDAAKKKEKEELEKHDPTKIKEAEISVIEQKRENKQIKKNVK